MADFFNKTFDEILNDILTDYSNLDSNPDTSEGTMTYIATACQASALWGLYKFGNFVGRQIFPDTAETDHLNHHGAIFGVARDEDDSDADYLDRVLDRLRRPPAGGNANDWSNWCKYDSEGDRIETTINVDPDGNGYYAREAVIVTPPDVSPGTVTAVIVPNDESILGGGAAITELIGLIETNIDLLRPVTSSGYTVSEMVLVPYIFVVSLSGDDIDEDAIKEDLQAYIDTLLPGEPLFKSQMSSIALDAGAENVSSIIAVPDDWDAQGTIRPDTDEAVRASSIVISVSIS